MGRLPAATLTRRVVEVVGAAYEARDLDDFARVLVAGVQRLVPSDLVTYNDIDPEAGRVVALMDPPDRAFAGMEEAWWRLSHQNPLYQRLIERGDVGPMRLSDHLDQRSFQRREIWREVYARLGARYHLVAALDAPRPQIIAVVLTRERRDYSRAEIDLLGLARPHLRRAYDTVRVREGLARSSERLARAVDSTGTALVVLGGGGEVVEMTSRAALLLRRHLGAPTIAGRLPAELDAWARTRHPSPLASRVITSERGRLFVRLAAAGPETTLTLREDSPSLVDGAARLGLTPRETQVMELVGEGLATAAVAARLGISARTVTKHLEQVYAKLEVRNRTTALAVLRSA